MGQTHKTNGKDEPKERVGRKGTSVDKLEKKNEELQGAGQPEWAAHTGLGSPGHGAGVSRPPCVTVTTI